MKKVLIVSLKIGTKPDHPILHSSGEILINTDEVISKEKLELLQKAGIINVLLPDSQDNIAMFRQKVRKKEVFVSDLPVGISLDKPVYDGKGNLLLDAGTRVSESVVNNLIRRGMHSIFIKQNAEALNIPQVQEYRDSISFNSKAKRRLEELEREAQSVELDRSRFIAPEKISAEAIDSHLDEKTLSVIPSGKPLINEIHKKAPDYFRSEDEKITYREIYLDLVKQTGDLFQRFKEGAKVNGAEIGGLAKKLLASLIRDRELLTNMINYKSADDYLLSHSVNVAILAANIGAALGYSKEQILELSYGALLHDVGMLKVPQEIREKKGELTLAERMELNRHPAFGLDLIQQVRGLPMTTPYVAYQSHERENGRGYPKGRTGVVIHDYARIVSVADVYESLCTDRPHRAAYIPYQSMEKVVLMGGKKFLSARVIKAFLNYLSVFPIGSWIELKGGTRAKVVATNSNYVRPVVSLMYDGEGRILSGKRVDLDKENVPIIQAIDGSAISSEMIDIMEGF